MKKIKTRNYVQLDAWNRKGGPHKDKKKEIPRKQKYSKQNKEKNE